MCLHLVAALCTVDNTSGFGAVASGCGVSSVHCGQGGVAHWPCPAMVTEAEGVE